MTFKDIVRPKWLVGLLLAVVVVMPMCLFGIAQGASIAVSMALACVVPLVLARRCSWWSLASTVAYCAVALFSVVSAIYFLYEVSIGSGATLEMHNLDSDAEKYYNWALHHYDGRCPEPLTTFFGFPVLMLILWKALGVSVVWPSAFNLMLTLGTIVMSGSLAAQLVRKTPMKSATAATIAISLMGLHGFFLSQGFIIQKEALVYMTMTMVAMSLFWLQDNTTSRGKVIAAVAFYVSACLILAPVRAKYINFAVFGIVILAVSSWRTRWRSILVLFAVTAVAWYLGMSMSTTYNIQQQVDNVVGGAEMTESFGMVEGIHLDYLNWMGGYFSLPLFKKLLLLPFTCGTQFVIPFPWGAEDDSGGAWMPRIRLGWYLCGVLALCYYGMLSWRRRYSVGSVAWWPVICFVGIAYISAGTVSRYILPFQPLYTAVAVYVIACFRIPELRRPLLRAFVGIEVLLAVALVVAFIICT